MNTTAPVFRTTSANNVFTKATPPHSTTNSPRSIVTMVTQLVTMVTELANSTLNSYHTALPTAILQNITHYNGTEPAAATPLDQLQEGDPSYNSHVVMVPLPLSTAIIWDSLLVFILILCFLGGVPGNLIALRFKHYFKTEISNFNDNMDYGTLFQTSMCSPLTIFVCHICVFCTLLYDLSMIIVNNV